MIKKLLIIMISFVIGIDIVQAKDLNFLDIAKKMKEIESEVTTSCISSNMTYNENSITISYELKNNCSNSIVDKWQTKYNYSNGIISFAPMDMKEYMIDNYRYSSDLEPLLNLEMQWANKLLKIIESIGGEKAIDFSEFTSVTSNLKGKVIYDVSLIYTNNSSILYLFGLAIRIGGEDIVIVNSSANSVSFIINPLIGYLTKSVRSCGSRVEDYLLYMYNNNLKEYEEIPFNYDNDFNKLKVIDNLEENTNYYFAMVDNCTYFPKPEKDLIESEASYKFEAKTLSKSVSDEENNSQIDVDDSAGNTKLESTNNNKSDIPPNPNTGEYLSLLLLIVGIISAIILIKVCSKKNKIFKI